MVYPSLEPPLLLLQLADMKDRLTRVLADMENLRQRTNRQMDQARNFAIQVASQFWHRVLQAACCAQGRCTVPQVDPEECHQSSCPFNFGCTCRAMHQSC